MNYFAYGSNLLPQRLCLRVPSASVLAPAELSRHRLEFHKRGGDGSGKCNALRTNDPRDRVFGMVYTMAETDRMVLDEAEGEGYVATEVNVIANGRPLNAFTYIARPEYVDPGAVPFDWYRDLVRAGASLHGIEPGYIRLYIDSARTRPDRNKARAREARTILALRARDAVSDRDRDGSGGQQ